MIPEKGYYLDLLPFTEIISTKLAQKNIKQRTRQFLQYFYDKIINIDKRYFYNHT
jgi:hypothetical protein